MTAADLVSTPNAPGFPDEFAQRYRDLGLWRAETFGGMLRSQAEARPEAVAVVCGERRWTYAELDERASSLAAGFARIGISCGDRVVVQLPNIAEFLEVCFGLWRLGALPVFALPAHRATEVGHFLRHSGAVAYVIKDSFGGFDYRALAAEVRGSAPSLQHVVVVGDAGVDLALDDLRDEPRDLPDVDPSAVAFLQLSGGSTGLPKLIPRRAEEYLYSVRDSAEICALGPDSAYLAVLPVAHNFTMSSPGWLGAMYAGGRVVLASDPAPRAAFPIIAAEQVTITALVPPLALLWLDAVEASSVDSRHLDSLQVLQVGGAKFSEQAARRVLPALGCTLQQVFGMAEGLVNYTRLDDPEDLVATTQGRPISDHDEVLVVDDADQPVPDGTEGHLLTRGPYTIRGYYRVPDHDAKAFTSNGFYRTGDLVRRLPTGHLVVTGRAKDQINRGGEKIAAEEVENVLLAHPQVHDVAVVAVPDDVLGERSCAFVVARGDAPTAAALRGFVRRSGLAAYKVPDLVRFLDSFPQTGVGKVSRRDLRAALTESLPELLAAPRS